MKHLRGLTHTLNLHFNLGNTYAWNAWATKTNPCMLHPVENHHHHHHQHNSVASSIVAVKKRKYEAACTIQKQFVLHQKNIQMKSALTQMNLIVQEHMEESAAGCLQRIWRGAWKRKCLLDEWGVVPLTVQTLHAHAITLRRQRKKQQYLNSAAAGNNERRSKGGSSSSDTNHRNRKSQHSSSKSQWNSGWTTRQQLENKTAPWRLQPRFAMWRLQWWLSRCIPRWRFLRKRKAAVQLQISFRYLHQRYALKVQKSTLTLQKHWRASVGRERFKIKQMKHFHMSTLIIQTAWWRYLHNVVQRQANERQIRQSIQIVTRTRYEQAMHEENYCTLVDRIHVLSRMQQHIAPLGTAAKLTSINLSQITERYFWHFKKRMFRSFQNRVRLKIAAFNDPNVNSPKHMYKLQESLLLASRRGDVTTVRNLLEDGVNPSCCNERGDTCLHMAVAGSSPSVIQLLLQACANISASDVLGRTCLHVVCETGNRKTLQVLLAWCFDSIAVHNSSKNSTTQSSKSPKSPKRKQLDLNAFATGNITPLHLCAMLGHDELARDLLLQGASYLLSDSQGLTAIHHAAKCGHTDCVNLLCEYDEEMILMNLRDPSGQTALHHAVVSFIKSLSFL